MASASQENSEEALRVYVTDSRVPLALRLANLGEFEGFPVDVEVSEEVRAF